jgi:hypothetical protein
MTINAEGWSAIVSWTATMFAFSQTLRYRRALKSASSALRAYNTLVLRIDQFCQLRLSLVWNQTERKWQAVRLLHVVGQTVAEDEAWSNTIQNGIAAELAKAKIEGDITAEGTAPIPYPHQLAATDPFEWPQKPGGPQ